MSAGENQNKTDAKKRKLEEVNLQELRCSQTGKNIEKQDFSKLCIKTSTKIFGNENSKASNDVFQPGKNFLSLFVFVLKLYFCFVFDMKFSNILN